MVRLPFLRRAPTARRRVDQSILRAPNNRIVHCRGPSVFRQKALIVVPFLSTSISQRGSVFGTGKRPGMISTPKVAPVENRPMAKRNGGYQKDSLATQSQSL